ncbi:uncharacterized protein M437DRAFT_67160 [Aureobasidium melanogenum CBS 110374]|uniref:C2H2-type domain-containing protein n=1 Tax=Aureobasidium melanogenum (strain CBS 110374) TaxID=1043003 RepID=A0A074VLW9_AURM1|nr:uncharacterized protein M437DRAFT_67160 [Aureobasidium melanogenum CBS 110374]KEQ61705.1 hypothetical protein M437DRAFT_67160 [Aureobasidium melanogenum CBS 110374]
MSGMIADLSAHDHSAGERYRNGKPWVLILRPRNNMSSVWVTLHEDAWTLITRVLHFALSVDGPASRTMQQDPRANPHPYYEAALVALRRWFYDGAGDPAIFLIHLENNIMEAAGRLDGRVRENWYLWRAYSIEHHGPFDHLAIERFETNVATEPNIAADNTSAEFFLSEAHMNIREDMTEDECRLALRLERRNLLGPAITSIDMLGKISIKMLSAWNHDLPDWMWRKAQLSQPPPVSPAPSRGSPAPSRGSPAASPGHHTDGGITKSTRPYKCEFCRSSFSTEAKKVIHIQTVHNDRLVTLLIVRRHDPTAQIAERDSFRGHRTLPRLFPLLLA